MTKAIWESCRFTTTDLVGGAAGDATCLFLNVGTTVPETVTRHVYGLIVANTAATINSVNVYHVPDGATGTQYLMKEAQMDQREGAGPSGANIFYPENPDPLKPIFPLEGGSKLYGLAATASLRVTVLYWDDILTGVEDT